MDEPVDRPCTVIGRSGDIVSLADMGHSNTRPRRLRNSISGSIATPH
ncbi:hypothetical protein ACO2Q2_16345 [Dyella sp. KRB-257]